MPVCSSCGQDNPDHARFCLSCGSAIAETAAPSSVEERKIVSILFADLVGFTASSDQADPEDVRAALRPYHGMLKREIERYGGTVEKFIGDAVMAVFGAPVSREDDAERAVLAGLRILDEMPTLNEERSGADLAVRVAVNTGEGLVNVAARADRGETLVTGDVVNTASRLQGVAPVGGLVVGEATYRATRDLFEYESLDPVSLKGKAEAVPIWRAIRAHAGFRRGIESTGATPFVGRDLERTLLQQAYLRTVREHAVLLLTITGEPGVGKSRLIHEFFRFIDDQPDIVWWRHGRCLPYGEGVSFWALGEMVKSQAGILESDGPGEVTEKLGDAVARLVEDEADREWIGSRLASLVGVTTEVPADRGELFAAWMTFLERMASQHPLVLIFEDLHWADDAMLEFIEHLVDWSSGLPILVLCTARPELYERHTGWGGGKRNATTIALSPLTTDESDELVSALLGGEALGDDVRRSLLERSGGNPLYAEEFIRMIRERAASNGNGASEVAVPETVHALIAARLDTLPPERKTILHDASVVGRVFWVGAVAHIGGVGDTAVRSGLHDLSRKELVRPVRGSTVKDEGEYSFWHGLVRDVAYGQIPRGPRSQKHRAAAEWIERLAGERAADHAEVLAHHYREAASLARAAGMDAEAIQLDRKLLTYLIMAGQRTFSLDARRSQAYLAEALELSSPDDPRRADILALAAEAAHDWGDLDSAERLGREAVEALRAAGRDVEEAAALLNLDDSHWLRGEFHPDLLERALSVLEKHPPSEELARVCGVIGFRDAQRGELQRGIRWLDRAAAVAEEVDRKDVWARILIQRGPARFMLGDLGGLDDARAALRLAMEAGVSRPTEIAFNNLADTTWKAGHLAESIDIYRKGIEFGERRGLTQPAEWSRSEMTRPLYEAGEWDEILAIADSILSPTSRLQVNRSQGVLFGTIYRARVLVLRGHEAEDLITSFWPRARDIGDLQMLAPALITASGIEKGRNRREAARDLLHEYERLTERRPDWLPMDLCESVRIALWLGESDRASGFVARMRSASDRDRCGIAGARAAIAEAAGDPDAARLYEGAAGDWERLGHVVEQGLALLGQGRCLVASGDRAAAAEPLRRAREIFERLRAEPLVAEADSLL